MPAKRIPDQRIRIKDRISDYIDSLPATQPAIERLKQTCRRALRLRFLEGFPDIFNANSLIRDSLGRQPAYVASANRLVEALTGLVDTAKKQGDITQDIPTEVLVYAAIGRVRDSELDPLIANGRIEPEALVEILVQMFLGGVVTDWQRSKMRRLPRS